MCIHLCACAVCPCGVIVKPLHCEILVGEFELHSCYCVYFQTIFLGKVLDSLIPTNYWLNSIVGVLLEGRFWVKIIHEALYAIKKEITPNHMCINLVWFGSLGFMAYQAL